jgi:hypothetical protein
MCGNNSRGFQRVEQRKLKSFRNETGRSNLHNCHSNVSPVKTKGLGTTKNFVLSKAAQNVSDFAMTKCDFIILREKWVEMDMMMENEEEACHDMQQHKAERCVQPANASSSQRWSQWDPIKRHSFSLSNRFISIFSIRF